MPCKSNINALNLCQGDFGGRYEGKSYSHTALIVTLIAETLMNKGIQANYEGMRVKSLLNFFSFRIILRTHILI